MVEIHIVNETIETLGDKYTFQNQRIYTLAREYSDNEFGELQKNWLDLIVNLFHYKCWS